MYTVCKYNSIGQKEGMIYPWNQAIIPDFVSQLKSTRSGIESLGLMLGIITKGVPHVPVEISLPANILVWLASGSTTEGSDVTLYHRLCYYTDIHTLSIYMKLVLSRTLPCTAVHTRKLINPESGKQSRTTVKTSQQHDEARWRAPQLDTHIGGHWPLQIFVTASDGELGGTWKQGWLMYSNQLQISRSMRKVLCG